jgi:hypothetical protein
LSAVSYGAIVPHAPVLLTQVVGEEIASETEDVRTALASLSFAGVDAIVLLSPHARASGVYGSVAGSLDGFGVPGIEVQRPSNDSLLTRLAEMWGREVRREPVDHGVLVPLVLLPTGDTPIVAAGLCEIHDHDPASIHRAIADGVSFARALGQLDGDATVALVVSAQTSAALTPRAPLTERTEAKPVEADVLRALRGDPAELQASLPDLWQRCGSCSPGTLAAYGSVFAGKRSDVLAYSFPFGVGYVVACAV